MVCEDSGPKVMFYPLWLTAMSRALSTAVKLWVRYRSMCNRSACGKCFWRAWTRTVHDLVKDPLAQKLAGEPRSLHRRGRCDARCGWLGHSRLETRHEPIR